MAANKTVARYAAEHGLVIFAPYITELGISSPPVQQLLAVLRNHGLEPADECSGIPLFRREDIRAALDRRAGKVPAADVAKVREPEPEIDTEPDEELPLVPLEAESPPPPPADEEITRIQLTCGCFMGLAVQQGDDCWHNSGPIHELDLEETPCICDSGSDCFYCNGHGFIWKKRLRA